MDYETEYKLLQDKHSKVMKELKRERRRVRKINRERFNTTRDDAANSDATKEIKEELTLYRVRYNSLQNTYKTLLQKYDANIYCPAIYSGIAVLFSVLSYIQYNQCL